MPAVDPWIHAICSSFLGVRAGRRAMSADNIAHALGGAKRSGDGWMAFCPGHDDTNPSLSLTDKDGKLLVHCHAGCDKRDVVDDLKDRGLWPTGGGARSVAWVEAEINDLPLDRFAATPGVCRDHSERSEDKGVPPTRGPQK